MSEQRKRDVPFPYLNGRTVRGGWAQLRDEKPEAPVATGKGAPIWNKLPRLLNFARRTMQAVQGSDALDYEPIHLHVNPAEAYPFAPAAHGQTPNHLLTFDNFRFLLDQVPAVRTIEFSGKSRDPYENPELARLVDYAYKFNGAECTIITDGYHLGAHVEDTLRSRLHTVVIRLVAHRPSIYALMTGQPLNRFVTLLENTRRLCQRKAQLRSQVEIDLALTVDVHNYDTIPALIRFAEELGVDGLRIENYLSPDPLTHSDKTLYTAHQTIRRYLAEVERVLVPASRLHITLPALLDEDMSQHRHCVDPYSTVSVDAEFNVSGCSRQLLVPESFGKIWDLDFFNNDMYKWLRSIHGASKAKTQVPAACQGCPRNMPCRPPV